MQAGPYDPKWVGSVLREAVALDRSKEPVPPGRREDECRPLGIFAVACCHAATDESYLDALTVRRAA